MTLMPVSAAFESPPVTVLVIDDDSSARESLRGIFESAGHRTIAVHDAPCRTSLFENKSSAHWWMLDLELPGSGRRVAVSTLTRATVVATIASAGFFRD
jgi:CheY-like chemotaxis protein